MRIFDTCLRLVIKGCRVTPNWTYMSAGDLRRHGSFRLRVRTFSILSIPSLIHRRPVVKFNVASTPSRHGGFETTRDGQDRAGPPRQVEGWTRDRYSRLSRIVRGQRCAHG